MSHHPFNPDHVRPDTKQTIDDYVAQGWKPGSFVQAVLENDLREAIGRADSGNLDTLPAIVAYCYNQIPSVCWGSPAKVEAWKLRHRAAVAQAEEKGTP